MLMFFGGHTISDNNMLKFFGGHTISDEDCGSTFI